MHCLIDGAGAEHLAERVDRAVMIHDPAGIELALGLLQGLFQNLASMAGT
jgi:hypothetical protein